MALDTLFTLETQMGKPTSNGAQAFHFGNLYTMHAQHSPLTLRGQHQKPLKGENVVRYSRAEKWKGQQPWPFVSHSHSLMILFFLYKFVVLFFSHLFIFHFHLISFTFAFVFISQGLLYCN